MIVSDVDRHETTSRSIPESFNCRGSDMAILRRLQTDGSTGTNALVDEAELDCLLPINQPSAINNNVGANLLL